MPGVKTDGVPPVFPQSSSSVLPQCFPNVFPVFPQCSPSLPPVWLIGVKTTECSPSVSPVAKTLLPNMHCALRVLQLASLKSAKCSSLHMYVHIYIYICRHCAFFFRMKFPNIRTYCDALHQVSLLAQACTSKEASRSRSFSQPCLGLAGHHL